MANKLEFDQLEEGLERVAKKQKTTLPKTLKSIDLLITEINKCKQEISASQDAMEVEGKEKEGNMVVSETIQHLSEVVETKIISKISSDHKELHAPISKLGKILEKNFKADIEKAIKGHKIEANELQKNIAQHLYRQGRFDLGDVFTKEVNIDPETAQKMKQPFIEMFQILQSMREHNLGPAIIWAQCKRSDLTRIGSSLEFKLHRLNFMELLVGNKQKEALSYARVHFAEFAQSQMSEIQHLMGSFLYAQRLQQSPYSSLFHASRIPTLWSDITTQFARDSCALMGLPLESPLHVCITAGFKSLPTFIKLASFQMLKLAPQDTATVEVDLGPEFQFHSVFACPVSREQSTKENPPMMLPCGHVICRSSMLKLIKGTSSRFKCPYCPSEQTPAQVKQVFF